MKTDRRVILFERRRVVAPGKRTPWRFDVTAADGWVLYTTRGRGPLGRLRAQRRAEQWCAARRLAVLEIHRATPIETPPADADAWLALVLDRLRREGVLPANDRDERAA